MNKYWISILSGVFVVMTLAGCEKSLPQNHLQLAKEAMTDNNPVASIHLLKRALQVNPEDFDARLLLARMYQKTGELGKAMANLEKAERIQPDSAKLAILMGKTLLNTGEYQLVLDRVKFTQGMGETEKSNVLGLRALAMLALDSGTQAKEEIAKQEALSRVGKYYHLARIKLATTMGKPSVEEQYLTTAIEAFPNDKQFQLLFAQNKIFAGSIEEGITVLRRLMDDSKPDYSPIIAQKSGYELVKARVSQGKFEDAEVIVSELLSRNDNDFRSLYFGGLVALVSGEYGLAERRLVRLEKAYSIESVRLLLGVVFMVNNSYERARFYLANYYASHRDDVWAAKLLMRTYMILGEWKEANDTLLRLDREKLKAPKSPTSEDAELFILRAMISANSGDSDSSTQYLEKASSFVNDNLAARKLLSKAYLDSGSVKTSIHHSLLVLQTNPIDVEALEIAVAGLIKQQGLKPIARLVQKFESAGGDPIRSGNLLARAMMFLEAYPAAEKKLKLLLDKHPDNLEVQINYAKAIELQGSILKANQMYESIAVYPNFRNDALDGLVRTAYLAGDGEKLSNAVELARSYDYKSVEPLLYQGAHYINSGDFKRADAMVREIQLVSPGSPAEHVLLAGIEKKKGNFAGAAAIVKQSLRKSPDYKPLLFLMIDLQQRLGNTTVANKHVERLNAEPANQARINISGKKISGGDWVSQIRPVLATNLKSRMPTTTATIRMLGLKNSEIENAGTSSGLAFSNPSSKRNYSYGRSGDLARINRTLFFKLYGSFAQGRISEEAMIRRADEGFFYGEDARAIGEELDGMLGEKKQWGPYYNYKDFDRSLRLPSWVAFLGVFIIVIVVSARWKLRKSKRNSFNGY